jgi:DNA topoisomerase-1
VAMWVIDILALRVGGEKDDKNEADTVGCCSLRVEHLTFNSDPSSKEIELEFLGKDSMLYKQTIDFSKYGPTGELVYSRLRSFCANKSKKQDVFETLTPSDLNSELSSLMPGLTAKVFRTYNASVTLEKELPTADSMRELSVQEKVVQYNAANREVAILCNHQKTVSKATEIMFENLNEKLNQMKSQQEELKEWLALAKKKKEAKIPLKDDDKEHIDSLNAQLKECQKAKETAKITEEKLNAANALEDIKAEIKKDQARRFGEKHMYKTTPNATQLQSRIDKWGQDIQKMETDIRNRDENKEVSLGTSKINYMDPRISVAWCKRCEVPIDRVFAKTLRDKFNWAMAVPPDWKFE